jgi:hypothetical protein
VPSQKATPRKRTRDIWSGMIGRCYNEAHVSWPYYGAKGIRVCERWKGSFENFVSDIGYIPEGMTIDRIDSTGNYEPSNVRLATPREQNNNKSNVRWLTYRGVTKHQKDWANELGITPQAMFWRVHAGWPLDRIFTTGRQPKAGRIK